MPTMILTWRRRLFDMAAVIALSPFSCSQAVEPATAKNEAAPPANAATEKERARRLERMMADAADYQLWKGLDDEQPLKGLERPVLRWSNPIRAAGDGALFIWADEKREKRPAAAMCIYGHGPDGIDHEWQSLSTGPLRAAYRGATVWRPQAAGLEFHPVAGAAEPPAATPARRLAQMRGLLRDFSATVGRETWRHELRVLTQPVYRYGDEQSELVDGAVFVLAQATDPEILLLLEARRGKSQPASWWWAPARMSSVHIELKHRGELVWTVEWSNSHDQREPRIVFFHKSGLFKPGDP